VCRSSSASTVRDRLSCHDALYKLKFKFKFALHYVTKRPRNQSVAELWTLKEDWNL